MCARRDTVDYRRFARLHEENEKFSHAIAKSGIQCSKLSALQNYSTLHIATYATSITASASTIKKSQPREKVRHYRRWISATSSRQCSIQPSRNLPSARHTSAHLFTLVTHHAKGKKTKTKTKRYLLHSPAGCATSASIAQAICRRRSRAKAFDAVCFGSTPLRGRNSRSAAPRAS